MIRTWWRRCEDYLSTVRSKGRTRRGWRMRCRPTLERLETRALPSVQLISHAFPAIPSITPNGDSSQTQSSVSPDGRFVVFHTNAPNVLGPPQDYAQAGGLYLYDRLLGTTTLIESDLQGNPYYTCDNAVFSADGNYIQFQENGYLVEYTMAMGPGGQTLWIPYDPGTFTYDLLTQTVQYGSSPSPLANPTTSANGRFMVFTSTASNVVPGEIDTNGASNVYLLDTVLNTTVLVSHNSGSSTTTANADSTNPVISSDGTMVAFQTNATDLEPGVTDTNGASGVYVYDVATGTNTLASYASGMPTVTGNADSSTPSINADGSVVVFQSNASNLVTADDNGHTDIFAYGPSLLPPAPTLQLTPSGNFPAGSGTDAVAVADLNGDGIPDVVAANPVSNTVSVLLGNGDGTFQAAMNFATGIDPRSVAVADLTGAGIPDIITANSGNNPTDGGVSVLLGNGNGTFQAPINVTAGSYPSSVAVADMNGDGRPDLIVANNGSNSVSVFLGNGNGTFQAPMNIPVGTAPRAVAVADVNKDGRPDLVVTDLIAGVNSVSVVLATEYGTFQPAMNFTAAVVPPGIATSPYSVAVADVDGDGRPDLIIGNIGAVTLLLGNGNGTFQAPISLGDFNTVQPNVAVADLNADGAPDLVVPGVGPGGAEVNVLVNNGDGTFQPPVTFPVDSGSNAVAVGDVNGDGLLDLITANGGSGSANGSVSVLLNATLPPHTVFFGAPKTTFYLGISNNFQVRTAGTPGRLLTVSGRLPAGVTFVYYDDSQSGIGTLSGTPAAGSNGTYVLTITAANGNGYLPIVTQIFTLLVKPRQTPIDSLVGMVQQTGQWWVGASSGASPLTNGLADAWSPGVTWVDVQTGDFNGDGLTDIVGRDLQSGQWWVGLSDGAGHFTTSLWATWSPYVTWVDVMVGDLNGDGKDDIIGRVLQTGQWWAGISTGTAFQTSLWGAWYAGVTWVDVKIGALNDDGEADIVGRVLQTGQWWAGISTGTSLVNSLWATWSTGVTWVDVQIGDLNGDGKADISGRTLETGQWWAGISTGTSFQTSLWGAWYAGVTWVDVKIGDFNGDGKDDLVGMVQQTGQWWVSTSTGTSLATSLWDAWSPGVTWVDVQVGDFNGDGKADIAGMALQTGQWYVGLSTGSSFATSLWDTWSTTVNWVDVANGHFN